MANRKIKIEDLRKFKFVSDPQISPDGKKIAFVLSTIDYDEDKYERHIWVTDVLTGNTTQFTHGLGNDTYPRWSPDGRSLLFLSRGRDPKEKKSQLWVIPFSGGEARLWVELEEGVSKPEWAPDSKRVLFLSMVWTEKKPDTDVKVIRRIKYKLNGIGTFEGRRTHLFTARIGRKPKQLTSGEFDVETAKWSPDGKNIAYISNKEENTDTSLVGNIFIMPSNGGESKKITEGEHSIDDLSWSPDGKSLAFIGRFKPENLPFNRDLWIIPSRGGENRNLTDEFDRSLAVGMGSDSRVYTPNPGAVWSRDGHSIYFVTASIPHSNIYKIDVSSKSVDIVVSGKVVDGFSISDDESILAFNVMDATHLAEIWMKDEGGERRLTNFNDRLLKNLGLSLPEHFTFINGAGEEIDGWIMKPYGFEEGETYPALLEIHGGPWSVYGDGMFHEFQVLASEGYAVFYTNPRGSAGYGEEYAQGVMRRYGEYDYEDLMQFTDEVVNRFDFVDRRRLGILGGSYGGYMTNLITCRTDRFSAAVTFRCVSNWVSKFGSSDVGYRQPETIAGTKDYWDEMEEHLKRSPIKHVKNVKTPTLIIHSEKDLRTPMDQGEQWFVALKLNGIPTEFVRFPDETHELSRSGKPKHREERLKHTVRWLNKYLH